jgi:hypothetical protein
MEFSLHDRVYLTWVHIMTLKGEKKALLFLITNIFKLQQQERTFMNHFIAGNKTNGTGNYSYFYL